MVTKNGRPAALLVNVQKYARLNEKQRGREAFLIARRHEMPIGSISPHAAGRRNDEFSVFSPMGRYRFSDAMALSLAANGA